MLKNYFKTALRNLLKHKADSGINLVGLCVAFTSALLLFLSVYYEFSYDDFHRNKDRLYQTYFKFYGPQGVDLMNSAPIPFQPALKASFPEVEYAARDLNENVVIEYKGKKQDRKLKYTDADFLKLFSFPMLAGSPGHALNGLGDVVLRKEVATALFGKEDPVGKIVRLQARSYRMEGEVAEEWKPYVVTGVLADPPENSSIGYDVVIRFENHHSVAEHGTSWTSLNHRVYVQMKPGVSPEAFRKKANPFMAQHFAEDLEGMKKRGAQPAEDGSYMHLCLLPITELHTNSKTAGGDASPVFAYLLLTLGVLIVLIACINFINLSIGRSFTRTREIGLRKTLGAMPWQLAIQFWCEVFLMFLAAFAISLVACYYLLPQYRQLFGMSLQQDLLLSPPILLLALGVFLLVTVLAGGYPVWLIARLQVADVLRGKAAGGKPSRLRNGLIVAQFSIATLLIICTIVAWQQIEFLRSQPVGYNRDLLVSIPVEGKVSPTRVLELMRQKLAGEPGVVSMSGIYKNLGMGSDGSTYVAVTGIKYKKKEIACHQLGISYDFVRTTDLQLVSGRDFSREIASDSNAVVINEALAAELGEKNPVGMLLPMNNAKPLRVIGVVKDFHYESLHEKVAPVTLTLSHALPINYILAKVAPNNLPKSMALLEATYKKLQPGQEFKGSFVDDNIERQYREEETLGRMFVLGAGIAIALSCMGLLAIVILVLAQRTREIGIRKVLGASVSTILAFIFKDFLRLIGIAILIASPLAWIAMDSWLQDYSYRITIQWWVFALAGAITVAIALLTILAQAFGAAAANPVKSLRTE